MASLEIELDDKGELVGQTPAELDVLLKRIEASAHGRGYSKGMSEAAEAAKKQIADNVAAELAKREALAPQEREKYARIDEENQRLKKKLLEDSSEADRLLKSSEEKHARELLSRADALKARESQIHKQVRANIRGLAAAAGARDESLSELETILWASIGFDEAMEPFVKEESGQAMMLHGKPIALDAYIKQYLDQHPHHKKAPTGQGGSARGGASFRGTPKEGLTVEAAERRIHDGDRSTAAINELFEATRRKSA